MPARYSPIPSTAPSVSNVAGARKIFPAVTSLDIMAIDWAYRSDPADEPSPGLANTLPVGR